MNSSFKTPFGESLSACVSLSVCVCLDELKLNLPSEYAHKINKSTQ